ncbi:peptidylprolyl isomerase [Aquimarina sp. AD1]|uniref:peptidylprolyl isomerase n=1 Tax=Aquimarina sp. (strain AD1) TaxID=1714848 RepID=UPI000E507D4A|nr:peptidylprolyl isomerase [Aquimarina sp. AD1]AXT54222.1 peptidylprolyl isomerase [Aquimarina sp. AD1]RKN25094.1 peptidylprolyl isomerase [Aquimarina sp. AD1]
MSLTRLILVFGFVSLFIFYSCEDTQSKKTKQTVVKNEKDNSEQNTMNQKDLLKTTKKEKNNISKTIDKEPFKLTNTNMKEFLLKYGKENPETLVRISTKFGDIDIKLYKESPMHRANFIYLVKQKYFDETFFYRVAKGFVIQGGNSDRTQMAQKRHDIGDYTLPQEPIKGLKHNRGSVALSKQWVNNPSNRSTPYEFFIVIAKEGAPHLNGEHTIFGKVIKGMSVADKISNVPVDGSEWPKENIFIKAEVIK